MADTKITALTALTAADPSTDVLPIVDTSDTTMAASGTTKKISINNILGASGTATLASATITGDLTVDTSTLKVDSANNRVGIGTASPTAGMALDIVSATSNNFVRFTDGVNATGYLGVRAANGAVYLHANNNVVSLSCSTSNTTPTEQLRITNPGVFEFLDGAGGTRMTLNSTGLGVGVSPDFKFAVNGTQAVPDTTGSSTTNGSLRIGAPGTGLVIDTGVTAAAAVYGWIQARARTDYSSNFNLVLQPNGGNVGIGVTPSAWNASFRGIDISTGGAIAGSSDSVRLFSNSAFNTAGNNVYKSTAAAGRYDLQGNVHTWNIAPSGTAGTTITFTPAMTLDGNGNLILQSSATPATLTTNGQLTVNATSNTNLRFSYRGSDGVTRVANITLA